MMGMGGMVKWIIENACPSLFQIVYTNHFTILPILSKCTFQRLHFRWVDNACPSLGGEHYPPLKNDTNDVYTLLGYMMVTG